MRKSLPVWQVRCGSVFTIEGNVIYFLSLVHERRHPQYLKGFTKT
jgi:hypothetical protein